MSILKLPKLHFAKDIYELPSGGELLYKLDGVQAIYYNGKWSSRANKPLYNLPDSFEEGVYEVYAGSWEASITSVRNRSIGSAVELSYIYKIYPDVDYRLIAPRQADLAYALEQGYEGLVYKLPNKWYKIKKNETYDVLITGLKVGTGKYTNKLGAFETDRGNVGTGLTDSQRVEYFNPSLIGAVIEVECMELTEKGMFRHPRFVRLREDKSEVSNV